MHMSIIPAKTQQMQTYFSFLFFSFFQRRSQQCNDWSLKKSEYFEKKKIQLGLQNFSEYFQNISAIDMH